MTNLVSGKGTVESARTNMPGGAPLSPDNPEGISTAITAASGKEEFISRIASSSAPRAGPLVLSPVPRLQPESPAASPA